MILESSSGPGLASILPDDSRLTWVAHGAAARSIASAWTINTCSSSIFEGVQSSTFASQLHKLPPEIQLYIVLTGFVKVAYFPFDPLAAAHIAQSHLTDHVNGCGFLPMLPLHEHQDDGRT